MFSISEVQPVLFDEKYRPFFGDDHLERGIRTASQDCRQSLCVYLQRLERFCFPCASQAFRVLIP